MYTCIRAYSMCVSECVYDVHTHTRAHTQTCFPLRATRCACMYTHAHTHTHTCFPLRATRIVQEEPMGEAVRSTSMTVMSVYPHAHAHTLMSVYTRAHAHTFMYTHTHTQTHTLYMHYMNMRIYTCYWRTVNRQYLITNSQQP